MTKTETLVRGLRAAGYDEVQTASKKYRCFQHRDDQTGNFMWVGNSGALRRGRNITTAMSWSNTDRYREIMNMGRAV